MSLFSKGKPAGFFGGFPLYLLFLERNTRRNKNPTLLGPNPDFETHPFLVAVPGAWLPAQNRIIFSDGVRNLFGLIVRENQRATGQPVFGDAPTCRHSQIILSWQQMARWCWRPSSWASDSTPWRPSSARPGRAVGSGAPQWFGWKPLSLFPVYSHLGKSSRQQVLGACGICPEKHLEGWPFMASFLLSFAVSGIMQVWRCYLSLLSSL